MNNKDRKTFWDTLNSLTGQNIPEECRKLTETIKYPKKLYRFRKADTNSLEAMRTNRLFFSSADFYDDPFDSFCSINWNAVSDGIKNALGNPHQRDAAFDAINKLVGCSKEQLTNYFAMHSIGEWTEIGGDIIEQTRIEIQKRERSICFTENGLNEVLWLKYADNHKGFVLEFDYSPQALLIDKDLRKDLNNAVYFPLYPVYYTNKTYDATNFARAVAIDLSVKNSHPIIRQAILHSLPQMLWEIERISLIKHKCHEYDKEWRIIHPSTVSNEPKCFSWIPSAVIIGLRTEKPTRDLIVALAREAGIPKIYECFIDNNNKLNKRIVKES